MNNDMTRRVGLFIVISMVFMFLFPDFALAEDPLEQLKTIYVDQAQTNAFPMLIITILALGAITSFFMKSGTTFIFAIFAAIVVGIAPDIAPNFTFTNLSGG